MPVAAGIVSSPSKSASREVPASLSRVFLRAGEGLLPVVPPLAGDELLLALVLETYLVLLIL